MSNEEQEALADFLRELPQGCKAITTSRRRGGEGALWLRLEKLDWDAARQMIAQEAEKDAGLAAKLRHAGKRRWQEMYDATGGSPLALSHTLGLMRVRAVLNFDAALDMLRGNRDPDLQNFIFQQARAELTANDEAALRALSFFAPSATFEAWAEVSQLSRAALETTIDRLSAISLVNVLAGEDRYALHSLTRNFVRNELLADVQTERETGTRFANYWVVYSQPIGGSKKTYKMYPLIEAEWANLDAAAEWLWQLMKSKDARANNKSAAISLNNLVWSLFSPLFYIGRWEAILRMGARAYEVLLAVSEWEAAGSRAYEVAWIHFNRAETDEAEKWADRCVEAYGSAGSKMGQALGMRMLGLVAKQRLDFDAAEQLFREALAINRDLGLDDKTADMLAELGQLELIRKNHDAAESYIRDALLLYERIESQEGIVFCYCSLGDNILDESIIHLSNEFFFPRLQKTVVRGREKC